MLRSHPRLILDEGNGVLVIFSLDWKVRSHYLIRNVATHVEPHIVTAAQVRHAAHHFKSDPIQQHKCTNRRTARKQGLQQFIPQDNYISSLCSIQFVEPTPFLEGKITNLIKLWLCPQYLSTGGCEFAHLVQIATGNQGSRIADVGGLSDVQVVLIGKQVGPG